MPDEEITYDDFLIALNSLKNAGAMALARPQVIIRSEEFNTDPAFSLTQQMQGDPSDGFGLYLINLFDEGSLDTDTFLNLHNTSDTTLADWFYELFVGQLENLKIIGVPHTSLSGYNPDARPNSPSDSLSYLVVYRGNAQELHSEVENLLSNITIGEFYRAR